MGALENVGTASTEVSTWLRLLKSVSETECLLTKPKEKVNFDNLDVDKVRLKVRENRTVINRKSMEEDDEKQAKAMNQQTFMEQVEKDANDRAEARAKAEYEAEVQRT